MLRVALTGGIATGKSYCLQRFASLGVPVIDADALARDVVAPGTPGLAEIVERFGSSIVREDGTLDRSALGRLVFADTAARAELETIIHPRVYRAIRSWSASLPIGIRMAIADIPLLFETGHVHDFDRVVVCACDPAEQLRRLVVRDHLSADEARARLAAQWPIDEKIARADFIIRTDGTFEETDAQIRTIFETLNFEV